MGPTVPEIRVTQACAEASTAVVVGGGVASVIVDNIQVISVCIMGVGILSQIVFNALTQLRLSRADKRRE